MGSSHGRPRRITTGVSEIYCCLPQSGSAPCGQQKQKLGIGFLKFPEDIALLKFWKGTVDQCSSHTFIVLIYGAGIFEIPKTTRICEFRAKVKGIKGSFGVGRKTQVEGSVPTINVLKREEKLIRKCPVDRRIEKLFKGVLNKLKLYNELTTH